MSARLTVIVISVSCAWPTSAVAQKEVFEEERPAERAESAPAPPADPFARPPPVNEQDAEPGPAFVPSRMIATTLLSPVGAGLGGALGALVGFVLDSLLPTQYEFGVLFGYTGAFIVGAWTVVSVGALLEGRGSIWPTVLGGLVGTVLGALVGATTAFVFTTRVVGINQTDAVAVGSLVFALGLPFLGMSLGYEVGHLLKLRSRAAVKGAPIARVFPAVFTTRRGTVVPALAGFF